MKKVYLFLTALIFSVSLFPVNGASSFSVSKKKDLQMIVPGKVTGENVKYSFMPHPVSWQLSLENISKEKDTVAKVILDQTKIRLLTLIVDAKTNESVAKAMRFTFDVPLKKGEKRVILLHSEGFEWDYDRFYVLKEEEKMKNFKPAGLAGLALGLAASVSGGELVANKELPQLELVKPKKIMDRDFWTMLPVGRYNPKKKNQSNAVLFPTKNLPPEIKKYMDIPAFTDAAYNTFEFRSHKIMPDGSMKVVLPNLTWIPQNRPFKTSLILYTRLLGLKSPSTALLTGKNKIHSDPEHLKEWKKRHPNLIGLHGLGEWGNTTNTLYLNFNRRYLPHLSREEIAHFRNTFAENPPDRRSYIETRLKPYFDFNMKVGHGDPKSQTALDAAWQIHHLAAYWGIGMVIMESALVYTNWQYQMIFCRGAARQFGIPWGWYAASHALLYNEKGVCTSRGTEPYAWQRHKYGGPDCGMSLNSRERVSFMAYLSGANTYERETARGNFWNPMAKGEERWKPQPEAKMYINFYNFVKKNPDRGIPYAPIALMVNYDRGVSWKPGKAFYRYLYKASDNMLDAFSTVIFPPLKVPSLAKAGIEMTLRNTLYGDIFDAITPDFENSEKFAKVLPAYKAAILIGEYKNNPGMVKAMTDYVKNGGTLVLNATHLDLPFPEGFTGVKKGDESLEGDYRYTELTPTTAKIILADENKLPVFTVNKYGKGSVIVGAPHYLVPAYDDSSEDSADDVMRQTVAGKRAFPYIKFLLDKLSSEVVPAKVTGDIQYGFNKRKDGWWIYLINNKGVYKTGLTPQKIDNKADTVVTIDLTKMAPLSVREIVEGGSFKGNVIKVKVPAGKCRIIEVKSKKQTL